MSRRQPDFPADEFRGVGPPVGQDAEGQRVDAFLARSYPFRTRRAWQAACDSGQLLVNGVPVRASRRLKFGDALAVWHPPANEPEVDTKVELLAQRDGILALAKAGNLPMHESGLFWRKTLQNLVAARFGAEWHAVHRLDRETSGVVLHAAAPALRRSLSEAFENRGVEKTYIAIARGEAAFDELEIEAPIALDTALNYPRGIVCEGGQEAATLFRVKDRVPGATLLEVTPRTGRFNQIRIHAEHLGLSLIGEKLYRGEDSGDRIFREYLRDGNTRAVQRAAGFTRHCLHAAAVQFTHPETGKLWRVEAALPDDMRNLWESLRTPSAPRRPAPLGWSSAGPSPSRTLAPAPGI